MKILEIKSSHLIVNILFEFYGHLVWWKRFQCRNNQYKIYLYFTYWAQWNFSSL